VTHWRELIRTSSRLTIRENSAKVGVSYGKCQAILTEDLNLRHVSATLIPRVLTIEQKEQRLSVATNQSPSRASKGSELHGRHHHR
jgi:hypothetical protein